MKFSAAHCAFCWPPAAGFTLVEMMAALVSAFLLVGAVIALGIFTSRSFYMMGNYADLNSQSRNAVDILGREIRNSSALLAFGTNSPAYLLLTNASTGTADNITYYSSSNTLALTTTYYSGSTPPPPVTKTLLTGCNLFTFSLYDRSPDITSTNITFYAATNAALCKVINFSWKCSRTLFGAKFNTESIQTAQIVLRNQISQ